MAGTDITNLLEIIQRKIDAADGNTATKDLLYLLSAVRKGDGTALELYDSSGAFPDLTDSDADKEMIAYKLDSDRLYFNVGVWKGKTLPPPPPPPPTQAQGSNFGYTSGGILAGPNAFSNVIDKFPFAADDGASDVGDLTVARRDVGGQSSSTHGYSAGGTAPPTSNVIDKFPFAADASASDVGDLQQAKQYVAGQSSTTHGYASGGVPITTNIQKFPFAVDAGAIDVGDLSLSRGRAAGQSSTTHGYASGGSVTPNSRIDKFPFSVDASASDVGDLTEARDFPAGQQY